MSTLIGHAMILVSIVALMWVTELLDLLLFGRRLDLLGIVPRTFSGLWGIVFAPFLHGDLRHLSANTAPLLVLGWLVMVRRVADFVVATVVIVVVGGIGVWLFGRPALHIGASGLIFGYIGYLLMRGYFERSVTSILLGLIAAVLYGGVLWGVMPGQRGVSWEGHLFGFLAGVLAARLLAGTFHQMPNVSRVC